MVTLFSGVWTGHTQSQMLQLLARWMLSPTCGTYGLHLLLTAVITTVLLAVVKKHTLCFGAGSCMSGRAYGMRENCAVKKIKKFNYGAI